MLFKSSLQKPSHNNEIFLQKPSALKVILANEIIIYENFNIIIKLSVIIKEFAEL